MPALGEVYWRVPLRRELVSINVDIYTATESAARIQPNQIHKSSGKRIRYEMMVAGIRPICAFVVGTLWLVLKSG
jgi:DNA end-binding protein Ku